MKKYKFFAVIFAVLIISTHTNAQDLNIKNSLENKIQTSRERVKTKIETLLDKKNLHEISYFKQETKSTNTLQKPIFIDINSDQNKNNINRFYTHKIISGFSNNKFHPQDPIRRYAFLKMTINSYRFKIGNDLTNTSDLETENYFPNLQNWNSQNLKYYNTAYKLGFLNNICKQNLKLQQTNNFVQEKQMIKLFKNIYTQFPQLVKKEYLDYLQNKNLQNSNKNITRSETVEHLINFFDLHTNFPTKFQKKLQKLNMYCKQFDIQCDNLYSPVSRKEFAQILSNILISSNEKNLKLESSYIPIEDINSDFFYPITYLDQKGYIDYLIDFDNGKKFFHPDKNITLNETLFVLLKIDSQKAQKIYHTHFKLSNQPINKADLILILGNFFDNNFDQPKSSPQKTLSGETKEIQTNINSSTKISLKEIVDFKKLKKAIADRIFIG